MAKAVATNTDSIPSGPHAIRMDLWQVLLSRAIENYKEGTRITGILDDKAQKTGALAGIFLAAALAFIKPELSRSQLAEVAGRAGLGLLAVAIVLLIVSIGFSLSGMWVRYIPAPLSTGALLKMTVDLLQLPSEELTDSRLENHVSQQAAIWQDRFLELEGLNSSKASHLYRSQLSLALAMLAIAVLLLRIVLRLI